MNQRDNKSREDAPPLSPFDWTDAGHVVVRAGEAVNWEFTDPASFIKRVQSIEYGLSAEIEFAAILSWLGRCSLVHRLDQSPFSSCPNQNWRIPDLLAVFEHDGIRVPVLIEVKTRRQEHLTLRTSDLESMQEYASALSLPLLVAWKPRRLGFWMLVDPIHTEERGRKSILRFDPSVKNNLLSAVAGDFLISPMPNTGIFFEGEIVERTRTTETGFEALLQITKAEIRDASGKITKSVPWEIMAIMASCAESSQEVTGRVIRESFVPRCGMVQAQQVLRAAVACQANGELPIRWRHVARDFDAFLSRDSLHDVIQSHFGTFVQYQFFQHPQVWPDFLPAAWNALT